MKVSILPGMTVKERVNKRKSNGQKAFRELLNTLSHQENINQTNSEVPSYTHQNG